MKIENTVGGKKQFKDETKKLSMQKLSFHNLGKINSLQQKNS